jgi:hypothetical protein
VLLQILGRNRIIVLVVLVLLNAGAGYALYEFLMPKRAQADQALSQARGQLETKRAEIQKLKEEYVLLQSQLRSFKELEAKGFFSDQSRVAAQESFEKMRTVSGVVRAKYNISAGELVDDMRATDAGYVILRSPIEVELDSLDDVDVYSFLKLIQERFPGKVDIVKMEISKLKDITPEMLRSIGSGNPETLVGSKISFVWRTMAPRNVSPERAAQAESQETPPTTVTPPPQGNL